MAQKRYLSDVKFEGDVEFAKNPTGISLDINSLPEVTDVADEDVFPTYDDSTGLNKKITWANLWLKIKGLVSSFIFPVGRIVMFDNTTSDPNTLYGNTWARVDGGMPAMYKSADTNFGTAMGTGGSLTHAHGVNFSPSKTLAGGTAVGHVTGTTNNTGTALPPYVVFCFWRRTA